MLTTKIFRELWIDFDEGNWEAWPVLPPGVGKEKEEDLVAGEEENEEMCGRVRSSRGRGTDNEEVWGWVKCGGEEGRNWGGVWMIKV